MGLLNFFDRTAKGPIRIPTGCFCLDPGGNIVAATLPSLFSRTLLREIGQRILETFREAQQAKLPLTEITVHYPSLRIHARDMRGGALVFLQPLVMSTPDNATASSGL